MSRKIVGVLLVSAALALLTTPASAHGARVGIGVGIGFPVFAYPPPIYVPPPRVVYYPPPPVVYAPPPSGLYADPTGPAYVGPSGAYCREFQTSAVIDGRRQPMHGTACQQPDGSWRVVR
ncbi:hypothetical protein [Azospirillum sp. TSO22-1]|uniref:hypothetical protein n=1 Tax=Azospirillum sp. TSO22-1 TaxID=716789 RepID=UPI000D60E262|nr:hypothetical protein [Azospirillum sp. TSO22-1]PWC52902.1 hypothetical protein TSO221_12305 [Azospirillum sp. TSO22-1]